MFVESRRDQGWMLIDESFDDDGITGATLNRPALERLRRRVRNHQVDQIVVHRLDRLSRSLLGFVTLVQEFQNNGARLVIVTAPELEGTPQDNFVLNILASFAEFERDMIASRIAESRARLKGRGLRIAGVVPFGYSAEPRTKQLVPEPREAAVVKWIFEQAAAGKRPAEIADEAKVRGWRTKRTTNRRTAKQRGGNLWTARQVVETLRNPVYLGLFRDKDDIRIGHHEPIITHELFAAAAAQLEARRTRMPGKRYQIDWPLKGLIRCATCGGPMTPHTIRYRNFLYRYYRCRATAGGRKPCGHQVAAHEIEMAVVSILRSHRDLDVDPKQIPDHVESVVYGHRDASITAKLIPAHEGEAGADPTESGQSANPVKAAAGS